jgi:hypothetical protein
MKGAFDDLRFGRTSLSGEQISQLYGEIIDKVLRQPAQLAILAQDPVLCGDIILMAEKQGQLDDAVLQQLGANASAVATRVLLEKTRDGVEPGKTTDWMWDAVTKEDWNAKDKGGVGAGLQFVVEPGRLRPDLQAHRQGRQPRPGAQPRPGHRPRQRQARRGVEWLHPAAGAPAGQLHPQGARARERQRHVRTRHAQEGAGRAEGAEGPGDQGHRDPHRLQGHPRVQGPGDVQRAPGHHLGLRGRAAALRAGGARGRAGAGPSAGAGPGPGPGRETRPASPRRPPTATSRFACGSCGRRSSRP